MLQQRTHRSAAAPAGPQAVSAGWARGAEGLGRRSAHRLPGEPGIWLVMVLDLAVFSALFVAYLLYLGDGRATFAASQSHLSPTFGVVNTLILLSSSLAVVAGVTAARQGDRRRGSRLLLVATVLGSLFVVSKGIEWGGKIDAGLVPATDAFFMLYYALTGLHLLHVLVGLLVLLLARRMVRGGTGGPHEKAVLESAGIVWHLVDMLWMVLFPLVYFVQ
jgi:nitric oxide reductase NorE protein